MFPTHAKLNYYSLMLRLTGTAKAIRFTQYRLSPLPNKSDIGQQLTKKLHIIMPQISQTHQFTFRNSERQYNICLPNLEELVNSLVCCYRFIDT